MLISKHLPALALPGLDLEFEIYHPPRLVLRIPEMDQSKEGLVQGERSFHLF